MKKRQMIFRVIENRSIHELYSLIILTPDNAELPPMQPGQFVQIKINSSSTTFLRRPISINYVDYEKQELWLLVRKAGDGTRALANIQFGEKLDLLIPLGNGFNDKPDGKNLLLIGGGVGIAPMLYLGASLKDNGYQPEFLIGARTVNDLLELDMLRKIGPTHVSTDDGSYGESGLVTANTVLTRNWDTIYCCGPAPMMKAVATKARQINADCYVSLENMMACGLGACLCCVEQTVRGNVCVCTEGPVFNTSELTW